MSRRAKRKLEPWQQEASPEDVALMLCMRAWVEQAPEGEIDSVMDAWGQQLRIRYGHAPLSPDEAQEPSLKREWEAFLWQWLRSKVEEARG